jgi:hypothetical protein
MWLESDVAVLSQLMFPPEARSFAALSFAEPRRSMQPKTSNRNGGHALLRSFLPLGAVTGLRTFRRAAKPEPGRDQKRGVAAFPVEKFAGAAGYRSGRRRARLMACGCLLSLLIAHSTREDFGPDRFTEDSKRR